MTSSSHLRVIVAAFLTCLLFFLMCGRFVAALPSSPTRKIIQQSSPPSHEGELLVRFRPGVSQHDKDTIFATHGVRRKKQLDGDSGVEKLEVVGRDLLTAVLEMLLN